jgi:glucose/arabinose dehydrogenase
MRGSIIVAAMALSACGANERRSEGAATQAEIENSAATPLPAPIAPRAPSPTATPTPTPTPTPSASATATLGANHYLGRWVGVEGMVLNVTEPAQGEVRLEMQYDLDNKGSYTGTITPEGIRFQRGPETLVLRPSDGDATGLKWLAGKKDCLTVKSGEGYCRD